MKKMCFYPPHTWNSHLESSNVFILFSRELHMRHMHIKLYFRINPIPRLEIDRAVTNGSAVYILLGEILCPPPRPSCI